MNYVYTALATLVGSVIGFSLGVWGWHRWMYKQNQRRIAEMQAQLERELEQRRWRS